MAEDRKIPFVDIHTHMAEEGYFKLFPSLSGFESKKDTLEFIYEKVQQEDKELFIFVDYDDSLYKERITKHDLDRITSEKGIFLRRVCGHKGIMNSKAIEFFKEKGLDEYIELNSGIANEKIPLELFDILSPSVEDIKQAILSNQKHYLSLGIRGILDFARNFKVFQAYKELAEEGKLRLKVNLAFYLNDLMKLKDYGIYTGLKYNDVLQIDGIKLFMDGSVGGGTAAFSKPYKDTGKIAEPFYSSEELKEIIKKVEKSGFRVLIHAIGDRAINEVVNAIGDFADFHHRIEHFEFPDKEVLKEVRKKGIMVSMQPNFVKRWAEMYREKLPSEIYSKLHPYRTMIEEDITFAFSSDSMPPGPLWAKEGALLHPFKSQRLTFDEYLYLYSKAGWKILGWKNF